MAISDNQQQQALERLLRQSPKANHEHLLVTATGGKTTAWPVRILSKYDYNYYNVQTVRIGIVGTPPVQTGPQMIAANMAESFTSQGQLTLGIYVIVFQVGSKNIFYAPV